MNDVFRPVLGDFVVDFVDDILVFSKTLDEHITHLRPYATRRLWQSSTPRQRAPFCRKTLVGKHSLRIRQMKPIPYRVRVIDSNIVGRVSRAVRTRRETEASPGDR
jgi:uncharacterized protein YukJ